LQKTKKYDMIIIKGGEYQMGLSNEKESTNIITVYHGSTYLFEEIDVGKGKPYKDFGRGFYVTENPNHAKSLALRNKRIEIERYNRYVDAYLYMFEIDLYEAKKEFRVMEFKEADLIWMQFVLSNRKVRERAHAYDIVKGPTADDDTSIILKAYFGGLYGEIDSNEAIATALRLIDADKLPPQVYFANNRSAKFLNRKGQAEKI
jgi:hypothetical protein